MWGGDASNTGQSAYVATQTSDLDWVAGEAGYSGFSAPRIDANHLYFKESNLLVALNFDGSIAWKFDPKSNGHNGSMYEFSVGDNETVYYVASNGDGTGKLLAISPNAPGAYVDANRKLVNGVKWTANIPGTQVPPVVSPDGTIYLSGNWGNVDAFNPDGSRKWNFNMGGSNGRIALSPDGATLYGQGPNKYLYAIDTATGQQRWRYAARFNVAFPTVGPDGTVYFIDYGWSLNALSPSGVSKWRTSLGKSNDWVLDAPSVSGDGQTIYAGGVGGLYAVSSAGTVKWKYNTGNKSLVRGHPALGADGTVYFEHGGTLRALNPSNGAVIWSAPGGGSLSIGADGTVYTGMGDKLLAYQTGGVGRPTAGYLRATPDPVAAGGTLSLRAYSVRDETSVTSVSFYRDTDGNGALNTAIDELVGINSSGPVFDSDLWPSQNLWLYYWGVEVTAPAAGTYTYFAQAVDGQGHLSNVVATTVVVADPLMASSIAPTPTDRKLTQAEAQPLWQEALSRWQAAGADTTALAGVTLRVADQGGPTLGLASGNTIWLDDNAAGWGWFVDETPWEDSEFTTAGDQGEQGRMDLLSALMHEMGHLLGLKHDEGGVMQETLGAGTRETLVDDDPVAAAAALDGYFASRGQFDPMLQALAFAASTRRP
jgi:hypothetical protein